MSAALATHAACGIISCPAPPLRTMQYLLFSGEGQLALEMVLAQDSSSRPEPESTVKSAVKNEGSSRDSVGSRTWCKVQTQGRRHAFGS